MTVIETLLTYAFRAVFEGELEVDDQEGYGGKNHKKKPSDVKYTYSYKPSAKMPKFNFPDGFGWMSVMSFDVSRIGKNTIYFGGPCYDGPAFEFDLDTMKLRVFN